MKFMDRPLKERKEIIKNLFNDLQKICTKYNITIAGYECYIGDFFEKEEIVTDFAVNPVEIYARLRATDGEFEEDLYFFPDDFIIEEK